MGEGFGVGAGYAQVEVLGEGSQIGGGWGGEVPVIEGLVREAAGVGAAVAAQNPRGVVGGVEGDAEEVGLAVEGRVGLEGFIDIGEVTAHAGAEVGGLAAGVDEGEEDGAAAELVEVDGAIALVKQGEVGHDVAGGGDVVLDGGFVVGPGLRGDDDVVEDLVVEAVGLFVDEEVGGDEVAGVEFGGDAGILEFVGHGHGVHEARYGVVIEGDVRAVDGYDSSAEVIGRGVGGELAGGDGDGSLGFWRGGGRPAARGADHNQCQKEAGDRRERNSHRDDDTVWELFGDCWAAA